MANTERLAVLQKVRVAHDAVEEARVRTSLTGDEQTALTKLAFLLEDLEDTLILQDITNQVESIKATAATLTDLVASMKQASAAIAKDLSLVNDAAGAVSALTTILSLGVSHGLV